MKRSAAKLLPILAVLTTFQTAMALDDFFKDPPSGPFKHVAKLERSEIGRGGSSSIIVEFTIPKDTHLTVDREAVLPRITPKGPAPDGIRYGSFVLPEPVKIDLDVTPEERDPAKKLIEKGSLIYVERVTLKLPFTVLPDAKPGPRKLSLKVHYAGCREQPQYQCFLPGQEAFELDLTVTDTVEKSTVAEPTKPATSGSTTAEPTCADMPLRGPVGGLAEAFESGRTMTLLFGLLLAGMATFLLPCVYPLVPITLSVIGARKAGSRWEATGLAASYGAGIVAIYVLLGLLTGLAGGQFNQIITHPGVVIAIALVCALLAFSMLGAFEFTLPGAWTTKLSKVGGKGYTGAVAMGAVSGLLSSACVGPALIFILLLIAQQGNPAYGALLLAVYGLGFALPYVIIGATAATLPKPGEWMVTIKKVGGLILLGVSIYYVSKILPQWFTLLLAGAACTTVGVFSGAFDPLTSESGTWPRTLKSFGIISVALGVFALVGSAFNLGFFGQQTLHAKSTPEVAWEYRENRGVARAKAEGKPAIIDFVSDTCTVCKQIEKTTFHDPHVIEKSRDFVMIKVDISGGAHSEVADRYQVKGLPTIIFLDRQGRERSDLAVQGGYIGPDDFLAKMRHALDPN